MLCLFADFKPKQIQLGLLHKRLQAHRVTVLRVVLYGCKTWSLTLREEHRADVFENVVLRRAVWPQNVDVRWEWRKMDKEEIPNVVFLFKHISGDFIKKNYMRVGGGRVAFIEGGKGACMVLLGTPELKRPFGKRSPERRIILKRMRSIG